MAEFAFDEFELFEVWVVADVVGHAVVDGAHVAEVVEHAAVVVFFDELH